MHNQQGAPKGAPLLRSGAKLRLHGDLSYCRVDDYLVFLDIQNDRYFRLTGYLESALVTYLNDGDAQDSSIRKLIERKILINEPIDADCIALSSTEIPTCSAMEGGVHAKRVNVGELLDTFIIVCSIHRQLKTHSLKRILRNLASLRERRTSQSSMSRPSEARVLEVAAAFRSARLYVPVDTCCLLDSIAMVKFLAKRELHAELVFGVTGTPFSAHSWVQHGTTVLNDVLGHTSTFTPIRVI
ncbi:lasso peptide biosynthesis B2 protein [Fulvimonas sp. R45]|uniref:lasso peptide biosynthesis B2 protein n=1 Tax=Fulvimonas sp. R45 TaxID=3045937 RepID=UPI00265DCB7C|nr:lasso peptide biosynthesis B2 protein [Fulvimonas sp. R45]MDO1529570.1 lasso peptide biosynthesis B2 protein [Fulvimonas sp. R45]